MRAIVCSILMVIVAVAAAEAASPHHVYSGVYIKSVNPVNHNTYGGGWDNDRTDYSLDREMVAWQGRNFAFEETFMSADYSDVSVQGINLIDLITYQELETIWYYGRAPIVNLSYSAYHACQTSLVQIDNGLSVPSSTFYRGLTNWASGLRRWFDLGAPAHTNHRFLFLAFLYEPNFSFCAVESNPATWDYVKAEAFTSAFRKARTIVSSVLGPAYASRVYWLFAPANGSNNFMPGFESYYPGDDVVDWMGLSAFNLGGYVKQGFTYPWQYFKDLVAPFLDRMRALAPRKPLALLQTAGISYGGDKNAWLTDLYDDAVRYPKLYVMTYFNTVVPGEAGYTPGFDWPIYWNDPYDARPQGHNVYLTTMRYQGWKDAISLNPFLTFSPIAMPPAGAFSSSNWNIPGAIAPISNLYNLFPELGDRFADTDGDGVPNFEEFASGLDPRVPDAQATETACADGIDNDANGRTDADDTVYCGDLPLSEGVPLADSASAGERRHFRLLVPGGSSRFSVEGTGVNGDIILYVKREGRPSPTSYDYVSSEGPLGDERVDVTSPTPGTWYVLAYAARASQYTLTARTTYEVTPLISAATALMTCDVDGNGQDDMVFSVNLTGVQALLNNSAWVTLAADGTNPNRLLCSDLNGDGIKEVAGVWSGGTMRSFDRTVWSWQPLPAPPAVPETVVTGDLDLDGRDDMIATFPAAGTFMYLSSKFGAWHNLPLGGNPAPQEVFACNMDADGGLELVAVFRGTVRKIRVYDYGVWSDIALPLSGLPDIVQVGDIDNDGVGDIVGVWRSQPPYAIYVRSGYTGTWREIKTASNAVPDSMPSRVHIGDVDGDRKDDIISVWDAWQQIQIFRQLWFGWMNIYHGPVPPRILVGNFDGDVAGRTDVAFVWSDAVSLWLNNLAFSPLPPFADVPLSHWAHTHVGMLAAAGVSTGCASDDPASALNEALYCPDDRVTRQAMAAFIVRAKFGDHFSYTQTPYFSDVPATHSFFKYIQKMRDEGFTSGCNQTGTLYCPSVTLTRQAMAAFIVRAKFGEHFGYTQAPYFSDVPATDPFFAYIQKMRDAQITTGYADATYRGALQVTRSQMAVFISRAFMNAP